MATWLLVVAYIGAMLYLVGRYQPNLIAAQDLAANPDSLYRTTAGRLYWFLAPVWQYNRYLVPILLLAAICVTAVAWGARRRERVAA